VNAKSGGPAVTQERLTVLVSPVVQSAGYDLEELVLTPMGRRSLLRVVIDRDEGITLDDIAAMSHAVADVLDADEGVIGKAPYALELTSPGVDRPLTEPRHWRRAIGRLVEVTAQSAGAAGNSGSPEPLSIRGRVTGFDGAVVTLTVDGVDRQVPLSQLGAGKVQLEFNRPDESDTGPKPERVQRQHKPKKGRGKMNTDDALLAAEEK